MACVSPYSLMKVGIAREPMAPVGVPKQNTVKAVAISALETSSPS